MILLVDMDAFFASVEQSHHPSLLGQPVIVCGDPERRGVVTAASYEARVYGVRAGMPLAQARRLCPGARYVEGNPEKYVSVSLALLELYTRWTPLVEPFSVDEAFLGLQGTRAETKEATRRVAAEVQEEVRSRFRLSASIGGGPNKLVAKMAAGLDKPGGITVQDLDDFRKAFWPLPVDGLWGVGEKTRARMNSMGLRTIGDLARCPPGVLSDAFGVLGPQLRDAARGEIESPLIPYWQGIEAKSMGHEITLPENSREPRELEALLLRLSDQVARRMRQEGYVGRVVVLKLRDALFRTRFRQQALERFTDEETVIFRVILRLLERLWDREPVRLLGVSVSHLAKRSSASQAWAFPWQQRERTLRSSLDRLRDRFGEASVVRAGALRRGRLSHVPFHGLRSRPVDPR